MLPMSSGDADHFLSALRSLEPDGFADRGGELRTLAHNHVDARVTDAASAGLPG